MNLVTGQARNRGLLGESDIAELPWTGGVEWCDQVAHRTLKMHAMATETIVHQDFAMIVFSVEENAAVGGAVCAGTPVGGFGLMALFAAIDHFQDVGGAESWSFGNFAAKMRDDAAHIVEMESGVEGEDIAVALAALYLPVGRAVPVRIWLPDFVTTGAGSPAGAFVVERNGKNGDERQRQCGESEPTVVAARRVGIRWWRSGVAHAQWFQFLAMYSPAR